MIKNTNRYKNENPNAKDRELSLAGFSIVPLFFIKCSNNRCDINQLSPNKTGAKPR